MSFVEFMTALLKWWEQFAIWMKGVGYWGISLWDVFVTGLVVSVIVAFAYGGDSDA